MNEEPPMTKPLLGSVHHIVCSAQPSSKKRARPWEDKIGTASSIFLRGFIFVSDDQHGQEYYSLVVPYQSLRIASYAASTGKLVQISKYSLLHYINDWGEMLLSPGDKHGKHKTSKLKQRGEAENIVIEVFVDGLSLASPDYDEEKDQDVQKTVLTLEMLAQSEQLTTKSKKKKSQEKYPINVTGVVDAVSPILCSDPQQEPFAILELYQPSAEKEESTRTAVVIIRGEGALSMHPAIHPGQTITLLGVVHRKWMVPDEFRKRASIIGKQDNETSLYERLSRVQGRVILVTEAKSIKWNDGVRLKSNQSLPSTVESLTSIRGLVKSVHYHCADNTNGKSHRILHFVTINLLTASEEISSENTSGKLKHARVYLPKYSIPPNVSLGLQPGSIIRAVNIHFIHTSIHDENKCPFRQQVSTDYLCYVACLRSTISIERCAGEYNRGNRSSIIWFVPACKPFLLVQDRRISDLCADPFHSKSSTQLLAEERLACDLQRKLLLTYKISNDEFSTLMRYHYRIVDDYGKLITDCQNVRCNCPEEFDRQSIRDPYAEFFDHAHGDENCNWIECGSCTSSFSRFNHYRQSTSETMPIIVDIGYLRIACTQYFIERIGSTCRRNTQPAGWTDSFCFEGLKMLQVLNDYLVQSENDPVTCPEKPLESINIYTGGHIKCIDENIESFILLYNNACAIPICELKSTDKEDRNSSKSTQSDESSSFRWVHIDSINVSCLCLGPSAKKQGKSVHSAFPVVFLPSTLATSSDSLPGNTFVFLVDNVVFIGSIHIIAKSILPATSNRSRNSDLENRNTIYFRESRGSVISIASCLEQTETNHLSDEPSIIIGRLIRHRFKFRKAKTTQRAGAQVETDFEKCYEGWSVTLCHIDYNGEIVSDVASMLQTIEVTISIPFCAEVDPNHTISLGALKDGLGQLFKSANVSNTDDRISSDQETMCLAWWRASVCSHTLPILSGGWDMSSQDSSPVNVEIPLSARTFAKLGYQRFRCHFSTLKAYHVIVETRVQPIPPSEDNAHPYTHKFLPGVLNRRLRRTAPLVTSPLTYLKSGGAVSRVSLSDLHWEICEAIRKEDSSCMKPSLLRRIHDIKILGISFCRARVECQRCFQALVMKCGNTEPTELNPTDGFSLLCPLGCSISHAAVKWECSAIIDDGTGQAKLYAEREAALLLLGTDLDVATVERGAWYCDEGVFFQPSLPPSSSLARSIKISSSITRKHISINQKRNINEELSSTYLLLQDIAKAEYLLQQHCRHWSHQHSQRKLDLFCRCKPLSEDISLNGTEINVAKARVAHVGLEFGMTPTTTLPPLKLNLEDACVCSEQRNEDMLTGWNLLGATKEFLRESDTHNYISLHQYDSAQSSIIPY